MQPLDPNADGAVTEIRSTRFRNGVVVYIYGTVKVKGDAFGDGMEFVKIVFAVFDVGRQSERGEITYNGFVGGTGLNNFNAEVRRFDDADILLVRFSCQMIISVVSKKSQKIKKDPTAASL